MDFSAFKNKYSLRLDPQQEAAVQALEGPVMLLAVPGSGKTTVLVSRIGYMVLARSIAPESILTMTYTVSAAGDMRRRFASLFGPELCPRLQFRTINGVCSKIIGLYEQLMGRKAFRLMEDGERRQLIARLTRRMSEDFVSDSTLNSLETAITYAKNQMLRDEELDGVETEFSDFPAFYKLYRRTLRQQQLMDYDDQMVYALQILKQYPEILQRIQSRLRYFCVDEAQDTSKIQHCIINLLSSASGNLFMVGDEDQSIYGFRAAFPRALTEFDKNHPGARILYMEQNYRSTEQIVELAGRFISKNTSRRPKTMRSVRGKGPGIKRIKVRDRQKQYEYLASLARDCRTETAVLYRDNDSALPIIDRLSRDKIPYRTRQLNSAFFTNRIVRDISDIIRLSANPADGDAFLNVYYKLGAGISKNLALEAAEYARRFDESVFSCLSSCSEASQWTRRRCSALDTHMLNMQNERADRALYRIISFMGYGEYLQQSGMDMGRVEILRSLGEGQESPMKLLDRLDELKNIVEQGSPAGEDCRFILSTIHASKGLEYEKVILCDVLDGCLPHSIPESPCTQEELEAYEEERRIFYVGITRAKNELCFFNFSDSGVKSGFMDELFPVIKPAHNPAVSGPRRRSSPIPGLLRRLEFSGDKTALYTPGAEIFHRSFGPGRIISRSGDIVSIVFSDGSSHNFSLSAALKARQISLPGG